MLARMRTIVRLSGLLTVLVIACVDTSTVHAADHGDTPLLREVGRHDARITDLFAFVRGANLVLIVGLDPTVPAEVSEYLFAPDLRIKVAIDNDSTVTFDNAADLATFGGTIVRPGKIKSDVVLKIRFGGNGSASLASKGLSAAAEQNVLLFAGLRDDPFIRGPRIGRNVAAVVLEIPLADVIGEQDTLLIWATSRVDDIIGSFQDLAGRALRSQFPENDPMNTLRPRLHTKLFGVTPDVMLYDTSRPADFPNGRELTDDVMDLVGDPRPLADDAPFPDQNDVAFLNDFPYLAPPQ